MLLDTSAWIEFFIKTGQGKIVKDALESETCFTSIVSIAEISKWSLQNDVDGKNLIDFISRYSEIINLNSDISYLAGKLNFERKKLIKAWGMMDSFILATSLFYNLEIMTKDSHFKDLKNVKLI